MQPRRRTSVIIGLGLVAIALTAIFAEPVGGMLVGKVMRYRVARKQDELTRQCPQPAVPVDSASLPIHITVWGNKGPAVWLVPGGVQGGIGGGPATFAGQRPLANRGWQIHLIDRPGFGQSPSRGPDDMNADARLIAARLDQNSRLIGHSFGGAEALLAAALRPAAVRSLILVEPALTQLVASDPANLKNPIMRDSIRRVAASILAAKTPADFAASFARSLGTGIGGGPNPSVAILQAHPEKAETLGCALLLAHLASADEMREAAQTVVSARIPVLVISGGYDKGQDATAELLAKQLNGQHVIVPSPNHFIQSSNPEEFNKVVDAFMRKTEESKSAP
jgi:pimeloyl-ACP methyl ester carboxylesterase